MISGQQPKLLLPSLHRVLCENRQC